MALRSETSPADLLALPASVYDAFIAAVLERDEAAAEEAREREARAERERLLADLKSRHGR